jgi:glycosyltransferase involved in cell wall biosynthesis
MRVARDVSLFERNPRIDSVVTELVRHSRAELVHVHHLVHLSTTLLGSLAELGVPIVVTLHDYWWLCVAGQLLNEGGVHEPEQCGERCLRYLLFNRHKAFGAFGFLFATATRLQARRLDRFVQERQRRLVAELRLADLVVAPSRSLGERYARCGVDSARIEHWDYGTELAGIVRRERGQDSQLRFGFLGRLVPEKGPHLLLEAFRDLGIAATLELFAEPAPNLGYRRELARLAERCGARFAGPFENSRVGEILDRIDVLVVPSLWWENSPIVIHEAFAAGIPVIAARAGGMAELVTDDRDGLLFELGNAGDLRRALLRIAEPGVLGRLSRGTRPPKSLAEDVSWHLATYRRLLERRAAG